MASTTTLNGKTLVLVDVGNLFFPCRDRGSFIDFEKFLVLLCEDRSRIYKAIAFSAYRHRSNGNDDGKQWFFKRLGKQGFEVVSKKVKKLPDGTEKGNCDVEIAIEACRAVYCVEKVVLVTGDGDFIPLVKYLQEYGIRVDVWFFKSVTDNNLIKIADCFYNLEEYLEAIKL